MGPREARVVFYTGSDLGELAIFRHLDIYHRGQLQATSEDRVIARGKGGFDY